MVRDAEAFKEYIRTVAGDAKWVPAPLTTLFYNEYVSREGALVVALEHCHFTDHFPRWFGNIIANCPHLDARAYMIGNMFVEEVKDPTIDVGHNESMWNFARALGATTEQIRTHEPMITTTMLLRYFDDVSRTRPWLEAFAAVGVIELINSVALAARYGTKPPGSRRWDKLGLDKKALEHYTAGEAADSGVGDYIGHGEDALIVLARHATTEDEQTRCAAALREAILAHKYAYDRIAERAIEATRHALLAR
jgi:pyrroloquinoline quinone (PQQ) biosynthesis protein C